MSGAASPDEPFGMPFSQHPLVRAHHRKGTVMDPNASYLFRQIEATERQARLRAQAHQGVGNAGRSWRGSSFTRRIGAVLAGLRAAQQPATGPMNQNVGCAAPTSRPRRA